MFVHCSKGHVCVGLGMCVPVHCGKGDVCRVWGCLSVVVRGVCGVGWDGVKLVGPDEIASSCV